MPGTGSQTPSRDASREGVWEPGLEPVRDRLQTWLPGRIPGWVSGSQVWGMPQTWLPGRIPGWVSGTRSGARFGGCPKPGSRDRSRDRVWDRVWGAGLGHAPNRHPDQGAWGGAGKGVRVRVGVQPQPGRPTRVV